MNLEKRIRTLEAKMITDPVVLHFADGSTRRICGRGDFLLSLALDARGGADLSSGRAAKLDLICQSVYAQESGGGHMVELLQCLLHASAEAGAL